MIYLAASGGCAAGGPVYLSQLYLGVLPALLRWEGCICVLLDLPFWACKFHMDFEMKL